MAVAGLYRRALPSPPAIEFASPDGKQLFADALKDGTMEGFFKLISYFQTQSEPAYCGLASLSVVLNALAIDPGRKWKGPWRWFDESMLDCCEPLEKVKVEGITFGKVACLAHCAGAKVEAFRANRSSIDDFRGNVIKCTPSENCHLIASYHRKTFKQTGTGHFSPIGGYHPGRDLVLILDVARFKYPPHWVPLALLWEAMDTFDAATGHPRGYMLISRLEKAPALLYTLNCRHESWVNIASYFMDEVPLLLKLGDLNNVPDILSCILRYLPSNVKDFITWVVEVRRQEESGSTLSEEERGRLVVKEKVLQQVHDTELFKVITKLMSSASTCCRNIPSFRDKDSLTEIAASVCCQGAELLSRNYGASKGFHCRETNVKCLRADGEIPVTIVSGAVVSGGSEQGIDMLIPASSTDSTFCSCSDHCIGFHPASNDLLTVLLLALPTDTWSGIRDERLRDEVHALVSMDNFPNVLQEEILHLRRQLHFLKRYNEVDDSLGLPSA